MTDRRMCLPSSSFTQQACAGFYEIRKGLLHADEKSKSRPKAAFVLPMRPTP